MLQPQPTLTTLDGSTISGTISGITAHDWTADGTGLLQTTTDLAAEWTSDYKAMLAGDAAALTPLQRMEGNAEAVLENTKLSQDSPAQQAAFREDAQREFDAIWAAMQINQTLYGINPDAEFNTYTYQMMDRTLESNEQLEELAVQGHGLNDTTQSRYFGYTEGFQNRTDNVTLYVGGGDDNGQNAIADFFDDVSLTHAPFPVVQQNGVAEQLNQNGNLEEPLATQVADANESMFVRVFVASDFSANANATGAVVNVPNPTSAPALPSPGAGQETTLDGSLISTTISGITAHTWTADGTGLFVTASNLQSEWVADAQAMQAGNAAQLTPLQRMEGNAEEVIENTKANTLPAVEQEDLRMDLQREFDAIWAAMQMNQSLYGIDPTKPFTLYSYQMMQKTLQGNEQLEQLAVQGHGLNSPALSEYDGYTTDFQNRTDNTNYYVGGGEDSGQLAIADFLDDVVLTHAPFPVVQNNGTAIQLNQNGNREEALADQVTGANEAAFTRVYVPADFSTNAAASGPVDYVPSSGASPSIAVAAPISQANAQTGTTAYTFTVTRSDDVTGSLTLNWSAAGSGSVPVPASAIADPAGTISFADGAAAAQFTVDVAGSLQPTDETFTATVSGPSGTGPASATATVGGNAFAMTDVTTGSSETYGGAAYSGPVSYLQWQFIDVSADDLAISAAEPNSFLRSGGGNDALSVSAVDGENVLDGGTGSNFLVGGTGTGSQDTFFLDDRDPSAATWSTIVNFHADDMATVFGITQSGSTITWANGEGAAGYTGLTLTAAIPGQPNATLTLAGFSTTDLSDGRLATSFGTESDGTPYLLITATR